LDNSSHALPSASHSDELKESTSTEEQSAQSDEVTHESLRTLRGVADTLAQALAAGTPNLALAEAAWKRHASAAEQCGDSKLSALLEDLALRSLQPKAYLELELRLRLDRKRRRLWAKHQKQALEESLQEAGCPARSLTYRVKSPASVFRKMQSKGLEFDEVHDLFAFRVVVDTQQDCYAALGVIHAAHEPLLGRFSDYIASPKPSGYRALHTIVRSPVTGDPMFEIQIRSSSMHSDAEHGVAAHWRYKQSSSV
jgi:GTP pyrophosphokinase